MFSLSNGVQYRKTCVQSKQECTVQTKHPFAVHSNCVQSKQQGTVQVKLLTLTLQSKKQCRVDTCRNVCRISWVQSKQQCIII